MYLVGVVVLFGVVVDYCFVFGDGVVCGVVVVVVYLFVCCVVYLVVMVG